MKNILLLICFAGMAVDRCSGANVPKPVKPPPCVVAPDDGVPPRWEKPKTTRRYLHGPLSERLLTFWREGKLVFAENEHRADWRFPYAQQMAHGAWLVRGDGTAFDFKAAELNVTRGGEPDHSQYWLDDGVCVRLSACSPFGRKPSVFARATFSNEGKSPVSREFLLLLRKAPEMALVHSGPDVYSFYRADVDKWLEIDASDWRRDGDVFRNGDRFASFRCFDGARLAWNAEKGGVKFTVELKPGETKGVDFVLGRGEVPAIGYDAARNSMKESWKAELSRLVLPEMARRDDERKKLVRHLAVQLLQCIAMPANGAEHVLPRQGGLQRLVWPGESIHVVVALNLLGLSNYADEICDFYMTHCVQKNGEAGPFRNNWAGDTAYVLRIFAQHCVQTRNTALWRRHCEKAERAFEWIKGKRMADGLFPSMKSTDSVSGLQHWGHTDLVNMAALEWYAKACEMFAASNAQEVRAEWKDYRAAIVKILDRWRGNSKGKDELFLPITATGEREGELVNQGFFYLHPAGFAESGLLTADELLRLRKNLLRQGYANEKGLYMRHPSPVPEFNRHVWYTTWCEKQWMHAWMRVGKFDLAKQALEATLRYSVSDEFIVGERYHDAQPWYFPWSPNASGSGRIVQMLFDSPLEPKRKYLVALGHDIMHARLEDYERKAKDIAALGIDGIAFTAWYAWPDDGRVRKLSDPLHARSGESTPISIRKADFSRSRRVISKIMKEGCLPKSKLRIGLTSKNRIDWRDDRAWEMAADNLRFLAEFAYETGLAGIIFDEEDYSKGKQFFAVKGDPPTAELADLVRRRGRQVFEAVFRGYPDLRFSCSWLFSTIQKWHAWVTPEFGTDQAAATESSGELWGYFMNGAIDAMPPESTIVEGNEERGYHGNANRSEFTTAAWRTSRGSLAQVAPENRKKFLSQLSISFGQYLDSYINPSTSEYYFPPLGGSSLKRWHENLQRVINVADDYVWLYGERGTYVNWERDLSKPPGVDTERCYYRKTWEEQLPGFSRMLKIVKGDYSPLEEDIKAGRMVRVGGLDSTWSRDKDVPKNRFERNLKPGLSKDGFARQNGSGCFCSRVKVKPGDEIYVKAFVKGRNPCIGVAFLSDGKFNTELFGRPRNTVPCAGWNHGEWHELRCHILVPEHATEASVTFGGPASPSDPNCFDCVGIYKSRK